MTEQFTRPVQRAAVLHHPKIEATNPVAAEVTAWLESQGVTVWRGVTWDEADVRPHIPEQDVIIVLGGDGSTLRAARMAATYSVPLIGINMGRLGFLSEMTPQTWKTLLPKVLAGQGWLEQRIMLHAQTWRQGQLLGEHLALNDVVISRGSLARVVRLKTEIDGDLLTTYIADGLIVATPTGSTAYAMAVGGPVMPPELHSIVVLPIAAHLSLNRALVLAEGAAVKVTVGTDHQAILTVDGQFEVELMDGDTINIVTSQHTSTFIRLGTKGYSYRTLLARLGVERGSEPGAGE
jgi:NAD+ kinase